MKKFGVTILIIVLLVVLTILVFYIGIDVSIKKAQADDNFIEEYGGVYYINKSNQEILHGDIVELHFANFSGGPGPFNWYHRKIVPVIEIIDTNFIRVDYGEPPTCPDGMFRVNEIGWFNQIKTADLRISVNCA
ncbi:hypothetical protein A2533_04430 [Candidatus Falkowbacteria bacterium RIFOXYD2_FULL_35_9]|nr:MAG: hypothetical protein A2533_04430 [Candidatus Falkowbacteria bacterium RIFOXYD2_FULL_35_9]